MAKEEKPIVEEARIPESLTINGVTYQVNETPELQAFIQAVAKVEKNKLYSKYEELKTQLDNLKNASIEGVGTINSDTLESLKKIFLTKEDLQTLQAGLPEVVKGVVNPLLENAEAARHNEIEEYRQKLITENADTCIPDLVKGNTKEELDAALAESIRLRSAYPATPVRQGTVHDPLIKEQANKEGANNNPTPTPTPSMPAVPQRPSAQPGNQPSPRGMSMEEFARNRENLQEQLRQMYGQQ
jgi:phage terminase small subunit